jgi:3-phosphoshikimate 1-carboxyvinyltransferase
MEIKPLPGLDAAVTLPGSKSYTQRALVIAALAEGTSVLHHALISKDTEYVIKALRLMGAAVEVEPETLTVEGTAGRIAAPRKEIYLGNNGTAIRLLMGVAALGKGEFRLTGDERLCERPVGALLDALSALGVHAASENGRGCPPVVIRTDGLRGGHAVLADIASSQFVSSLLISCPLSGADSRIDVVGPVPSRPYVDMTVEAMHHFGVDVEEVSPGHFLVRGKQRYQASSYTVEGDVSSASYFCLAAAVCRGTVRIHNINPGTLQGDIGFLSVLERLGVQVARKDNMIEVTGGSLQRGDYEFDFGPMPDVVPTFAVLAALRPGRTVIRNISHLRMKESNRLEALVNELRRVGIRAEEIEDGMVVVGGKPHGAVIETYNDHRIAMSFAILGLAVPGITISNPACVGKSFPGFWNILDRWY